VDVGSIADRFRLPQIVDWNRIDRLAASGHLNRDGTRITLTAKGRLLLDHILGEIALGEPMGVAAAG
jgi:oxygen-independent coproporphyrinogen-3 oxidase